jgi:hypothetical protein
MTNEHLSDADIQEYLFGDSDGRRAYAEHLQACEGCSAKVGFYRQMSVDIKGQAEAKFDFDLSESVLSKIAPSQPANAYSYSLWLFIILSFGAIAGVSYLFGHYIINILLDVSGMAVYLVLITAGLLLLFQSIEIIKKHKRQMELMDFN